MNATEHNAAMYDALAEALGAELNEAHQDGVQAIRTLAAQRDAARRALRQLAEWCDERAGSAAITMTRAADESDDEGAAWYGGRSRAFREAQRRAEQLEEG